MKVKLRYILLFVLPALVFYTIFVVYPIGYSFNLSFFSWPGVGEKTFVGFDNFKNILTGSYSEEFFNAVWHSFQFFIANSIFELGLAFIIAIALTSKIWGKRFFSDDGLPAECYLNGFGRVYLEYVVKSSMGTD